MFNTVGVKSTYKEIRSVWKKIGFRQKTTLLVCYLSPIITLFILGIFSLFGYEFITMKSRIYLLIMWIYSSVFALICLFFFFHLLKEDKSYGEEKSKIIITLKDLLKNRIPENVDFCEFCGFIILVYYLLALTPRLISFFKEIEVATMMYFVILFLFTIFLDIIINYFSGFQEKKVNRFLILMPILGILTLYYLIFINDFINDIIDFENLDIVTILQQFLTYFIPILIPLLSIYIAYWIRKNSMPKKPIKAWEQSINRSLIAPEFLMLLCFLLNLLIIFTIAELVNVYHISPINILTTITIMTLIFLLYCSALCLLSFAYPVELFLKNIKEWSQFFNCYKNSNLKRIENIYKKPIKIIGKVRSISVDESYKKKYDSFHQHFLIEIEDSREDIDVFSLLERNPFRKTLSLVSETDRVTIIGEMKAILDDSNLIPDDNRISDIIIAYHIEKV